MPGYWWRAARLGQRQMPQKVKRRRRSIPRISFSRSTYFRIWLAGIVGVLAGIFLILLFPRFLPLLRSSAALVIWIAYGLANAAVVRLVDAPDGLQWTGLQGIGAAIGRTARGRGR